MMASYSNTIFYSNAPKNDNWSFPQPGISWVHWCPEHNRTQCPVISASSQRGWLPFIAKCLHPAI